MIIAGLTAGAIAAIVAALVSLPLHSPVDSAFNSATVAVAALVVGLVTGLLWMWLSAKVLWYAGVMAALFVVVLVVALAGNTQLERLASFSIPLAIIVIALCALLTPLLASFFLRPALGLLKWSPAVAVVVALVVGFGLITQGDAESGELALPPRPTAAASTPTEASTPSATADAPTETPTAAKAQTAMPTAAATVAATSALATPARPAATPTPVPAEPTEDASGGDAAESALTFIVGDGSKATFTVEEELGRSPVRFDAVIESVGLSGTANLDGRPSVVTLDLHSLSSDQEYRDRYIQSRMFPDTPEAVVTVDRLPDLPQSFFDGEETSGTLSGSLQIGDTVTPLEFEVTARHDGSSINVLAKTAFTWEQLGLAKPAARSVVYLADEVRVQVLLIGRAAP